MKKIFSTFFVSAVVLAASAYTIQAVINWKIDNEKALVKFTMQAHGQDLAGSFKGVKGDINFDENDLGKSSINVTIDIATVNTGNERRDGHLQAKDWFDAGTTPVAKFSSTNITKTTDGGYAATGNFTVKATTKEITVPFTYEGTKDAGTFKGTAHIHRKDFGVGPDKDDPGNDIEISFDIPVTKN